MAERQWQRVRSRETVAERPWQRDRGRETVAETMATWRSDRYRGRDTVLE